MNAAQIRVETMGAARTAWQISSALVEMVGRGKHAACVTVTATDTHVEMGAPAWILGITSPVPAPRDGKVRCVTSVSSAYLPIEPHLR